MPSHAAAEQINKTMKGRQALRRMGLLPMSTYMSYLCRNTATTSTPTEVLVLSCGYFGSVGGLVALIG